IRTLYRSHEMILFIKNSILFIALLGNLSAQFPTGTIAGVVRDPSGSAVSSSQVKLISVSTHQARTEATSEQGDYSFPALPAGDYQVTVEGAPFQRMVRTASVEAGATTTADFNLR